jgi:quercetin dioxygenase-like cupin family protein
MPQSFKHSVPSHTETSSSDSFDGTIVRPQSALIYEPTAHSQSTDKLAKMVHLRNGEVPHVHQFARSRFSPGSESGMHAHDSANELFYVVQGSLEIEFTDGTLTLAAGDSVTVLHATKHNVRNRGDSPIDAEVLVMNLAV